jgi:Protein of unknown function (DUF3987)
MHEPAVPIYDIAEGCHRFSFPDATHLEILRPQQDALGRLWAEVVAKHGDERVFNRARFDLLDLEARLRFHAAAARVDGTIDWGARLLFALEHVRQTLQASEMDGASEAPIASPSDRVEPFPIQVLPTPLARLVTEGAAALPCPPDFLGVLMLPLLGAAIGTSRVLEVKAGWHESPRLYAALVAEPGSKKSPALDLVATPYRRRQRTLHTAYLHDRARYQHKLAQYERDLADWKSQLGRRRAPADERPQAPHEPILPQVYTTDTTLEALAALLEQNPRGIVCLQDELTGWVLAMDQYKGGKGADRHGWLSCWNGAPILVNRKTRQEPIVLDNPFVNVVGCLPPDLLSQLIDARGREDGFVHRLLFAFPDPLPMHWTEVIVRETTIEEYCRVVDRLWTLQGVSAHDPQVVPFTNPGRQTFVEFANALYAELADPDCPDMMRGPLAKLEGYGARLALLLHLCRCVCGEAHGEHVDEGSVLGASALVDYFKSQARRVYSRLHLRPEDQRVERVIRWIQGHGGECTVRDLLRGNVGGCKRRQEAETLLQELVDRGLGQLRDTPVPGGRIQTRFAIHHGASPPAVSHGDVG